jgi:hypothetical protein
MIYSDGNGYIAPQGWLNIYEGCNVPPVENAFEDRTAHLSIDVLVCVLTIPGRELMMLVGWYSYYKQQWQYYGVDPSRFDDFMPLFFTTLPFMPITANQAKAIQL